MTSHLERLPGELRNKIYEYALTMDEGVCYREDEHGVGWLCLHVPKLGEHSGLMTATVEADVIREAGDEASARKRRKFISEDRDIDEPVQDLKETQQLVRVNGHIVACQLQFVNRLFRNETKALVLRYNDIYFLDSPSRISKFLSNVLGRKRSWIQKIVDREESGNSYSSSSSKPWDLVLKDEMHPKFTIHVHYPRANLDHENFFVIALLIQCVWRRNSAFLKRITGNIGLQQTILRLLPSRKRESLPSFVKFFPWEKTFDEARVREMCTDEGNVAIDLAPSLPGGVDDLVAVAKEWYENGY